MLKYIGKRLLASILTIWVVITLTFFLMRLMPGGPFDSEKLTPEIKANMEAKYGMDKPLGEQYALYMKNLVKGDLGESMVFKGRRVSETISYSFPASAKIGLVSVASSVLVGVGLGIVAALKKGTWADSLIMLLVTLGITIPSFVIGAVLIYFLTVELRLLPATGFSSWKHYIMPVIALSLGSMAFITRLTRNKLLDVLKSDYIRTAKAKGLSKRKVILKHALRNSLIPIVTYVGPLIASILTGSFVVEKIFAIPGLGNEFVQSVTNRDYTMLLGVTVFFCTLLIMFNFIVDIMYVVIDPRIKLEDAEV
ncbi:ABC transporter permease [Clostridium botulinum]|uniref:Oligopeptide transport system permease protein OppB n=4 Tax=Clostridium TaxID=1485 RepID=B2TS74_CLOBB|nr:MULTISPECIES: ABC transporter permease [Clostridium]ACD23697.1 oligopeptide transport system permease protein OppB [Clostridium botulinum B str. Eklund 17B (NRP)]AIY81340.1 binding--dependent transport system inner membrane component family protein [Clostridium botulinum 202F]KAI3346837.1 ABC transporter permease [Clostridium botulinum]KFX55628.1 peptide ABC transporter permease [Clostridium botulinum]KFX55683.1 peptide ABC transporter permease [Clostridium botulinum]